ncbi:pentatricopeptide repeat-containing protein At1g66345, mitochondrial [Carica papaya]|uniref:pentatricopeptide repeat-containing protein At1g66345, mitochondrial n=1 Tax=Carica papaya TaxID=3649 RepID=UPI000B8CC311|nr:pentatricopeptide repeat-containing protein At1g66345, mitochondrial [Carica papaya]
MNSIRLPRPISSLSITRLLKTHTQIQPNTATTSLSIAICDSLRAASNWETLSAKFSSIHLTDSLINTILLQLKEPTDAKRALGFFHWSAKTKNHPHGIRSYCIAIHILVRARLLIDARALLESLLKNTVIVHGSREKFSVVDSLLDTYQVTNSIPLVLDLLVQGYAKLRMIEIGFDVCRRLDEHGFTLSVISFNSLLHVVQKSDRNDLVWRIYEHIIERRIYPNEITIRIMVSALCKEGKLKIFIDMSDRIHGKRCAPPVIVNTSLIFTAIEEGRIEEAMVLTKRLLQKNMILDTIGFSLFVYAKTKLGDSESAWQVFEEMLKRGFNPNSFLHTSFIGAYCREGKIEEANRLLEEMEIMGLKPYAETFNHLIHGCARAGRVEESLNLCEKMVKQGTLPSCSAFNEMLEKVNAIEDLKRANGLLTILLEKGFIPDEITYSHLIIGHVKGGEVEEAFKLYYEMEYRALGIPLQVFESLIGGLCRCGKPEEGERYLRIMKDRFMVPSVDVYHALVGSYCRKGDKKKAVGVYREMMSEGLNPSGLYDLEDSETVNMKALSAQKKIEYRI